MSMNTFAVYDYGLYITEEDVTEYALLNDEDTTEVLENFSVYGDADGTAYIINENGGFSDNFLVDDYFAIGCLNKYPSLFKKAYESYEDALNELKKRHSEFLNKDFDYKNRFVSFRGTMFG